MTRFHDSDRQQSDFSMPSTPRWKRLVILWAVLTGVGCLFLVLTWNAFFKYVPPGKHLVIISKNGGPLDPGEVLAKPGQKGIQADVQGEGWHFVMPIAYTTELEENTIIPAGKVGVVTAKGGQPLPPGQFLADEGQQGIQRQVLPPGTYRINRHGFDVEEVDAVEIRPGYVGVLRRLLGKPGTGRFAENDEETGILRQVLQPGLYYLNPKEYEVIKGEVGIEQTSFHKSRDGRGQDNAITFTSSGGFPIDVDCTIEWEVLPEDVPALVAEYGLFTDIERKVIDVQAHAILRDKGIDYGVKDFLEGATREKFQNDFTQELTRVCKEKSVTIHSAFIRRIDIPDQYLKPIRDSKIALETQQTNQVKEATAQSAAEVERAQQMIAQEVAKVEAQTKLLVGNIEQEVDNTAVRNAAEIEKMKADYASRIATLNSQRTRVLGEAEANVKKMKETAKSSLYQLKMNVYQGDANAFLRAALAEQLNPDMILRFFHSGTGTLWTNMDSKGMNLMLPAPVGETGKSAKEGRTSSDK
jgi:hypothetical protein